MKAYVASGVENVVAAAGIMRTLRAIGIEITYDWTGHGSVKERTADVQRDVAVKELRGVADADVLVVVLPGGYGTHAELGAALALGIPVVLIYSGSELGTHFCVFHQHPKVRRVSRDALVETVLEVLGAKLQIVKAPVLDRPCVDAPATNPKGPTFFCGYDTLFNGTCSEPVQGPGVRCEKHSPPAPGQRPKFTL